MKGSARILAFGVLSLFLGLLILSACNGTYTFADALRSYEIGFQYKDGAAFNTLNYPSSSQPLFQYTVAWWAPAQWVLPHLLIEIVPAVTIQSAQFILITLFLCLTCSGFYYLFQAHFKHATLTWLSLLIIISHPLFYWQTFMYTGGDLFLLGATPWLVLFLSTRSNDYSLKDGSLFFLFGMIGLLLKTSFLLLIAAGAAYLFFRSKGSISQKLRNTKWIALASLFLVLIAKFVLIGANETPGSASDTEGYYGIPPSLSGDLLYSIGSPIGAITQFSKLAQQSEAAHQSITVLSESLKWGAAILVLLFLFFWKKGPAEYRRILLLFGLPFLLLFIPFYLLDRAISFELRHFAPVIFLFIPAFVHFGLQLFNKYVNTGLIIGLLSFNAFLFFQDYQFMNQDTTFLNGFKLNTMEAAPYKVLDNWDKKNDKGIAVLEDYWAPSVAVRKNDKLVLTETNDRIQVVSGMELDHPDVLADLDLLKSYDRLIIMGKIGNRTDIFKFTSEFELIDSGIEGGFEWKTYINKKEK